MTSPEPGSSADILIIGGGIIGVCSAYYLAKEGRQVTLVERGEIGAGCSSGNAGILPLSHSLPLAAPGLLGQGLKWMLDPEGPFYIKPRPDPELFAWLWRFRSFCREEPLRRAIPLFRDLQRASLNLYRDLVIQERLDCHFEQSGGLTLFKSVHGYRGGIRQAHLLQEYGLQMDILDAAAVQEIEPAVQPDIVGAVYHPEDGHLDPALFVQSLAKRAAAYGANICAQTEVIGFETKGQSIAAVETTRGSYHPGQVVLAAGAWSNCVARDLGLKLPLQPAKGYSVTIKRPGDFPRVPLRLAETKVVATPLGPHLRFAGTLELAGFDAGINRRRVKAILRAVEAYLLGVEKPEAFDIWGGFRPLPPDGVPYIGRTRTLHNLIVATGHSYLGISMGPVTGKLVAQIVCEETPLVDLSAMRVERFG